MELLSQFEDDFDACSSILASSVIGIRLNESPPQRFVMFDGIKKIFSLVQSAMMTQRAT